MVLRKALGLLTNYERAEGLKLLLLVILMSLFDLLGIVSILPFLTLVSAPEAIFEYKMLRIFFDYIGVIGITELQDFLLVLGLCSFLIIVGSSLFKAFIHSKINFYGRECQYSLSCRLLSNYLAQDYAIYFSRHSSDLIKSVISEVDTVVASVLQPVFFMIAYLVQGILIVSLLFFIDPLLALAVFGTFFCLYGVVYGVIRSKLNLHGSEMRQSNAKRHKVAVEAFASIKLIKLMRTEGIFESKYANAAFDYARAEAKSLTYNQIPTFFIEAFIFGGLIILVTAFIVLGGGGDDSLSSFMPMLGLYALSAYRLKPAAQSIYQGMSSLKYGEPIVSGFAADFANTADKAESKTPVQQVGAVQIDDFQDLLFSNVSYTYPGATEASLLNISLKICKGDHVGIVGETGAGKTTFVDLLLGLLHPTAGEVFVNSEFDVKDPEVHWHRLLGYVPQEIVLIDSSLKSNIAFNASEDDDIDLELLARCASAAQIDSFILNELELGYDTEIGERGVRLSGGQRQRIGIARALYTKPKILVLDEATSALDALTEQAVLEAISDFDRNMTIIAIAHRLNTIKKCHRIVMLGGGRVLCDGDFNTLKNTNNKFKNFVDIQRLGDD